MKAYWHQTGQGNLPKRPFFGFNKKVERVIQKNFEKYIKKEIKKVGDMSVRENIASNIVTTISGITSPAIKKVSRQPFPLDELSQQQYPAVLVQTIEETKDDQELGSGSQN